MSPYLDHDSLHCGLATRTQQTRKEDSISESVRQQRGRFNCIVVIAVQHNIVFQQKPAFNVSVKGSLHILHHRLAPTDTVLASPGSAQAGRYVALECKCHASRVILQITDLY